MNERILGRNLSVYKAISLSLGQSKKQNSEGELSKFVAMTLKDKYSIGARPVRHILFEDEIGPLAFEELMNCRDLDASNQPRKDSKGGYIVNLKLVKQRSAERMKDDPDGEDELMLNSLLSWEGGMTMTYKFPSGPRYANDANNKKVVDKSGDPVVKDEIEVFVQVKDVIIKDDGTRDYTFVSGMTPNGRGERIMRTFFKEPVVARNYAETAETAGEDAENPIIDPGF